VLSWLILRGRCRSCHALISWLYPFIELLTALSYTLLWLFVPHHFFITYALFFSALIVTIRTDLESFLVFRAATWGVIPFAFLASAVGLLPLSLVSVTLGALFGYSILWITRKLFWWFTHKEGLGLGDLDLLTLIGAFTGIQGAWLSLVIGSFAGLIVAAGYLISHRPRTLFTIRLPFAPFLALGALCYVLAEAPLTRIFLGF
jgi:leader peptidase (prepilin peptidase) / N-methyltransferase